jgi:hypothetical protein
MDITLLTFAHLLVFVYWLGGDIGAFVASFTVTEGGAAPSARLAAASILSNIDMAPRTALVLVAPTGLTLAASSNWLSIAPSVLVAVWLFSLLWLALIWRLHLTHAGSTDLWRQLDLALRWGVLAALLAAAVLMDAPLFLRAKLALLALAIALGLLIRVQLARMGAGFAALARGEVESPEATAMTRALSRARGGVVAIWVILASAALLGVAKPV